MEINKVGILGWYGYKNLGDTAVLEGLKHSLGKFLNAKEFEVFTDSPRYSTVQTFDIDKVNQCDLFVLGGGELICKNRLFLPHTESWVKEVTIPKIIMGCGVNVMLYDEIENNVRLDLCEFDHIGLRDQEAVNILRSDPRLRDKVSLSLDNSMSLYSKYPMSWQPKKGVGVVIPTDRSHRMYDAGIQVIDVIRLSQESLKKQLKEDKIDRVILLPFGELDNDDYRSCLDLESYLRNDFNISIEKPQSPRHALEIMSCASKAYAYRLHGLLFAYILGVPFSTFGYHWKVKRNYDTLIKYETVLQAFMDQVKAWKLLKEKLKVERSE